MKYLNWVACNNLSQRDKFFTTGPTVKVNRVIIIQNIGTESIVSDAVYPQGSQPCLEKKFTGPYRGGGRSSILLNKFTVQV